MTEILVTTQTTPDAPPPVAAETPAEPAAAVPATPDTPPAKTPEQIAADTQLQADRKEVREIAEAQARAWRAGQELKARDARIAELEAARKVDLEQLAAREELALHHPLGSMLQVDGGSLAARQDARSLRASPQRHPRSPLVA